MDARFVDAAVIGWSPELRLTHVEGACEAVLGRPAGEVLGRTLGELFGIPPERARELDGKARSSAPTVEFVQSGDTEEARVTYRLRLGQGDGRASAGVMNLQHVLDGAPPVQISRLSSSLSHEIRNPLSSVKMAVQTLARNTTLGERDRRRLAIANREIRTMERMLWLLSEYGRDSAPHLEAVPLRTVLQEASAMVALELSERRIEVRVAEEEDLPRVKVDAGRLRPVLAQLLLNVAMGQAEGTHVEVSLKGGPPGHVLMVLVDPSGALPEEKHSLFEPFGTRLARGAGLSLAALRRVLLNQRGEVSVQGSSEPGLVFTLQFAC